MQSRCFISFQHRNKFNNADICIFYEPTKYHHNYIYTYNICLTIKHIHRAIYIYMCLYSILVDSISTPLRVFYLPVWVSNSIKQCLCCVQIAKLLLLLLFFTPAWVGISSSKYTEHMRIGSVFGSSSYAMHVIAIHSQMPFFIVCIIMCFCEVLFTIFFSFKIRRQI